MLAYAFRPYKTDYVCHVTKESRGYIPADDHVLKDPEFKREDRYFLSNDEAFDASARKAVHIIQTIKKMDITNQAEKYYFRM